MKIVFNAQAERRKKFQGVYYEKHHIIPRSLGGSNKKENLVLLTAKEHFICHLLLTKMCINTNDTKLMVLSFFMMRTISPQQERVKITSSLFQNLKIEYAAIQSELGKKRTFSQKRNNKISQALKGHYTSEETKQKISQNHHNVSGTNNPMYGKNHTEESKYKMRIKAQERNKTIQNPMLGRNHTEETKKIISEHGKIKWNNGSRDKMISTLSKGQYITPWGIFISAKQAVNHVNSTYKDAGTVRYNCINSKKGFSFIPNS
jgi:hypothetical protein